MRARPIRPPPNTLRNRRRRRLRSGTLSNQPSTPARQTPCPMCPMSRSRRKSGSKSRCRRGRQHPQSNNIHMMHTPPPTPPPTLWRLPRRRLPRLSNNHPNNPLDSLLLYMLPNTLPNSSPSSLPSSLPSNLPGNLLNSRLPL
ncbi:hypothetical protein P280DRAFT_179472 [Massarina eburnea CBS 473.64]|uniref:Uncharacterized protein n=1 Tax=Massarina eburnea CBS 473.64 TaxID=1395130 RepID=A0A6A6SBX4_9PLEO|nr:hypothetical protein P280DRAFT_179472 [Massarina eburnea CBS 473.64]